MSLCAENHLGLAVFVCSLKRWVTEFLFSPAADLGRKNKLFGIKHRPDSYNAVASPPSTPST